MNKPQIEEIKQELIRFVELKQGVKSLDVHLYLDSKFMSGSISDLMLALTEAKQDGLVKVLIYKIPGITAEFQFYLPIGTIIVS